MSSINVTPDWTFSTIQFDDEIANTIVSSILVVLILVNFNSMVHKLVSLTHRNYFNYASFLRAYIFSSSDDISRILAWARGQNSYLPEHWPNRRKKVVLSRLFYPLLARSLVFILSIGSIALTIPANREFKDCQKGDFTPFLADLNEDSLNSFRVVNSLCSFIEVYTTRGDTNTTLNFCSYELNDPPDYMTPDSPLPSDKNFVYIDYNSSTGEILTLFGGDIEGTYTTRGFLFYLEWTRTPLLKLRSLFQPDHLDCSKHFDLALAAVNLPRPGCAYSDIEPTCATVGDDLKSYRANRSIDCGFNPKTATTNAALIFRSALRWEVVKERQDRVAVTPGESIRYEKDTSCPYYVTVSRPIVNLAPLLVALAMIYTLNVAVGLTISEHGDIGEVSFHIMKEALGLDVTCNPLEETPSDEHHVGGSTLPLIRFCEFSCANGVDAHGGFFIGNNDVQEGIDFNSRTIGKCSCQWRSVNLNAAELPQPRNFATIGSNVFFFRGSRA